MDPDKAFAVQMTLEESVLQEPVAYIQCALLYTSSNGERRIRWGLLSWQHQCGLVIRICGLALLVADYCDLI